MKNFKWFLIGLLSFVAVTATAKMFVGGELEKAGAERLAADPVTNLFSGRMYYNTVSNTIKFYDGVSWGDVGGGLSVPTGTISSQVGTTVPAGWLPADGSCQVTATYPALQAEVVTGGWNQTGCAGGEFRMPDLRNRFLRGTGTQVQDGFGGVAVALGVAQDDKTSRNGLTATAASSSISGTAASNGAHTHNHTEARIPIEAAAGSQIGWADGSSSPGTFNLPTASAGAHPHSVSGTASAQTITVGAGDSETNPKAYGVNYIIKT